MAQKRMYLKYLLVGETPSQGTTFGCMPSRTTVSISAKISFRTMVDKNMPKHDCTVLAA